MSNRSRAQSRRNRALLPDGTIADPKGIFRFKTLAEANRQQEAWLAEAMAEFIEQALNARIKT